MTVDNRCYSSFIAVTYLRTRRASQTSACTRRPLVRYLLISARLAALVLGPMERTFSSGSLVVRVRVRMGLMGCKDG